MLVAVVSSLTSGAPEEMNKNSSATTGTYPKAFGTAPRVLRHEEEKFQKKVPKIAVRPQETPRDAANTFG